ncbi:MAG: hypothetical protein EB107_09450 [Proteobacteria bacterium]|nr:hypothetical protein [Pseudomonadota bacterium]
MSLVAGGLQVLQQMNQGDVQFGQRCLAGATPTPGTTPKVPKGRIVVVGNTEFASNTLAAPVLGNRDFFVNSVNWLAEEEDLISIRAEPQSAATVVMTNQSQVLVFFTTVVLVPVSALLIGIAIWWQRR